jgi:hypothetical protein
MMTCSFVGGLEHVAGTVMLHSKQNKKKREREKKELRGP